MGTIITLGSVPGGKDGYGHDLRLERELESPIVVDATSLRTCHPMFLVRLRLFVDWHLAAGHEVRVIGPTHPAAAGHLADMGFGLDLPDGVVVGLPSEVKMPTAKELGSPCATS